MAKVIEELIVIKLSKIVRNSDGINVVLNAAQRKIIEDNIDELIDGLLNDNTLVVELADLE